MKQQFIKSRSLYRAFTCSKRNVIKKSIRNLLNNNTITVPLYMYILRYTKQNVQECSSRFETTR